MAAQDSNVDDDFFTANAPPPQSNPSVDANAFVSDLAKQYGVEIGSTDAANLAGKNPEDVAQFERDLEAQYQQRANNVPGGHAEDGPRFGSLTGYGMPQSIQPWTGEFKEPTAAQVQAMPGYQFDLDQGIQALQRSAASKGSLLTGGTLKGLTQFGQNYADTNYQTFRNNAFQDYADTKDSFLQNETNRFGSQQSNQLNAYNQFNTDRQFNFGIFDSNRNFGRLTGLDAQNNQYRYDALLRPTDPNA